MHDSWALANNITKFSITSWGSWEWEGGRAVTKSGKQSFCVMFWENCSLSKQCLFSIHCKVWFKCHIEMHSRQHHGQGQVRSTTRKYDEREENANSLVVVWLGGKHGSLIRRRRRREVQEHQYSTKKRKKSRLENENACFWTLILFMVHTGSFLAKVNFASHSDQVGATKNVPFLKSPSFTIINSFWLIYITRPTLCPVRICNYALVLAARASFGQQQLDKRKQQNSP